MKTKLTMTVRLLAIVVSLLVTVVFCFANFFSGDRAVAQQRIDSIQPSAGGSTDPADAQINAKHLLLQSADELFNSLPVKASSRLQVNLFDQRIVALGNYLQMGQGTGLARLQFDFGSIENPLMVLQICNRGYYYRFQTTREQPDLKIADLRRIADVDQNILIANQNTWMATGGLSSLLEHLSRNFEFEPAQSSFIDDTPVWRLNGTWNEDRLRRLLFGQVKYSIIKNDIDWLSLPAQIPHSCEILLGKDQFFPLFPYRITFFQQQEIGGSVESVQVVSFELYEVEKEAELSERDFDVHFEGIPPDDLTKRFVDRIQNLNLIQRSAKQRQTPNQTHK